MYIAIVNPLSGQGRALRAAAEVEAELARRGIECRVMRAADPDDTRRIAREAAGERPEGIVAIGGDGTFFDVPPGRIDLGRMNDTYFLNVSGTGFDVDVLRCVDRYKDRGGGLKPYLLALWEALKHYRPAEAMVSIDGGPEEKLRFAILSVGNGRYIGGGMRAVPDADPMDGLFDVVIVRPVPKPLIPLLIAFYIAGLHVRFGLGKLHRCKKLTITRPGMTVNLDGELRSADAAKYELLASALNVRLPRSP